MKRRSVIARRLRNRRQGQSCWQKYQKVAFKYEWQAPWKRTKRPVVEGDRHV